MAKKVVKRGRPVKNKKVPTRSVSVGAASPKTDKRLTGAGSGSGTVHSSPGLEPCLFPCPSLRRVSNQVLPRMGAVLACQEEEAGIRILGREDLDALQLELETLLSSVVVRLCQLNDQLTFLSSFETVQRGRGRKQRKARAVIPAPVPASVAPASDDKLSINRPPVKIAPKKPGGVLSSIPSRAVPSPCKQAKMLRKRPDVTSKTKPRGKQLEKDLTSHKFWSTLDPYCCDVTEHTYNLLSDFLYRNQTEVPFLYEIPPLGEHFTKDWIVKDSSENQDYGCPSPSISNPSTPSSPISSGATPSESIGSAIRRKFRECSIALKRTLCTSVEKTPPPVSPPPTPATSKLMAALLGELPSPVVPLQECKDHNVIVKVEKEDDDKFSLRSSLPNSAVSSSTIREIPWKHQRKCLDRKFRLEKEAQGDIEQSLSSSVSPQSLLYELKRSQAELKLVVDQNSQLLENLTNTIADELKFQRLKRKLQEVDDKVIDIYHTRTAAKLAKQSISQEDVNQAWKALKERDQVIRQINSFERKWSSKVIQNL